MLRRNIPELTSLRFFAALAVVISHLHGLGFIDIPTLHDFLDGGRTAVAFFFILSGFVLAVRYAPGQSLDGYAVARFARIYPVHLLTLLISVVPVLVICKTSPALAETLFFVKDHARATLSLSFVAQILLLTAWLPFAALNQPWNGPAWSLSCEAFFYSCFPWLRGRILRMHGKTILWALLLAWCCQGLWLFAVGKLVPASRADHIIYQFPLSHVFEFFAGVCVGVLYERGSSAFLGTHRNAVLAVASVSILALSYFAPLKPAFYLLSPVFLVAIAAIAAGRPIAALTHRSLLLLGGASYSLYLVHVPVLLTLKAFGLSVPPVVIVPMLVLLSVFVFHYVEEPCRRRMVAWVRNRQKMAQAV